MFLKFVLKKVTVTVLFEYYPTFQEPETGAGAGFEICLELEPEPENQKRTGSGNAVLFSVAEPYCFYTDPAPDPGFIF